MNSHPCSSAKMCPELAFSVLSLLPVNLGQNFAAERRLHRDFHPLREDDDSLFYSFFFFLSLHIKSCSLEAIRNAVQHLIELRDSLSFIVLI